MAEVYAHSLLMIKEALDHKNIRSTEVYAHISQNARKKAIESNTDEMLNVAGKENMGEIIEFDPRKRKRKVTKNA